MGRRAVDVPLGPKELAMIQTVEERLKKHLKPIEQHLANLEGEVDVHARQLGALQRHAGVQDQAPGSTEEDRGYGMNRDRTWPCQKCGTRLGHFDEATQVLRSAKGTHCLYIHVGVGGWVEYACPVCRHKNLVDYIPDGSLESLPVAEGHLVLSVPLLEALLAQAAASANGYVAIPIEPLEGGD